MKWKVGDKAHVLYWTDREPVTVIAATEKSVTVQWDKARSVDGGKHGMGHQNWEIERDPDGATAVFTLRKNGKWIMRGQPLRDGLILLEGWTNYYDWSF